MSFTSQIAILVKVTFTSRASGLRNEEFVHGTPTQISFYCQSGNAAQNTTSVVEDVEIDPRLSFADVKILDTPPAHLSPVEYTTVQMSLNIGGSVGLIIPNFEHSKRLKFTSAIPNKAQIIPNTKTDVQNLIDYLIAIKESRPDEKKEAETAKDQQYKVERD